MCLQLVMRAIDIFVLHHGMSMEQFVRYYVYMYTCMACMYIDFLVLFMSTSCKFGLTVTHLNNICHFLPCVLFTALCRCNVVIQCSNNWKVTENFIC